jgi:hypothetical protein
MFKSTEKSVPIVIMPECVNVLIAVEIYQHIPLCWVPIDSEVKRKAIVKGNFNLLHKKFR